MQDFSSNGFSGRFFLRSFLLRSVASVPLLLRVPPHSFGSRRRRDLLLFQNFLFPCLTPILAPPRGTPDTGWVGVSRTPPPPPPRLVKQPTPSAPQEFAGLTMGLVEQIVRECAKQRYALRTADDGDRGPGAFTSRWGVRTPPSIPQTLKPLQNNGPVSCDGPCIAPAIKWGGS